MTSTDSKPSSSSSQPTSVIFVCLGNICRSPMAEGVFQHLLKSPSKQNTHHPLVSRIDSAGTAGYNIGNAPDPRTMSTLRENGITTYTHSARKFAVSDFTNFDYVLAMDAENLEDLQEMKARAVKQKRLREEQVGRLMLFGDFGGVEGEEVVDPYYGGRDGFDVAYEQMVRFSRGLLSHIEEMARGRTIAFE